MDGLDFFAMKGLANSHDFFEFAVMHIEDVRSAGAFVIYMQEILEEKEKEYNEALAKALRDEQEQEDC